MGFRYVFPTMNGYQVRRATVEDLPQLRQIWMGANLPVEALEKCFTDYQVVQDNLGILAGALAFRVAENQACLYGEAYARSDDADMIRALFWPRLQIVARNLSVERVWTTLQAPYWRNLGFTEASAELLERIPSTFSQGGGDWLSMTPGGAMGESELEKQMAILKAMNKAEYDRTMDRARLLRWLAFGVFAAVGAMFIAWIMAWNKLRSQRRRHNGE